MMQTIVILAIISMSKFVVSNSRRALTKNHHSYAQSKMRNLNSCFVPCLLRPISQEFHQAPLQMLHSARMAHASSSNNCKTTHLYRDVDIDDDVPTMEALLERAQLIREKLYGDKHTLPTFLSDSKQLSYPSSAYNMAINNNHDIKNKNNNSKSVKRGFCNWLIPQTIMIGQYPGMTPESYGASLNECNMHIQNMVQDANISMFCCLQTEVPSQEDDTEWDGSPGKVYLEPLSLRREFPRPFTRYGQIAQSFAHSPLSFLHNPIEDLSVPTCNDELRSLLSQMLRHLEVVGNQNNSNNVIYIHCWGGRGRAGTIGSCLVSLLFPELSSKDILNWVQCGYDTRAGAEFMPEGLKRSPQTEQQRWFVKEFTSLVQKKFDTKK